MLERDGRIVAIDVLRGLAILWVISFHLWVDMTFKYAGADHLYFALRDRIGEGDVLASATALGEVVLGTGFHGVALFMVLSGLSLTLNAYRRGEPPLLQGYRARWWKILPVYWSGIAFFAGTIAFVAVLTMIAEGVTFREGWDSVTIAVLGAVTVTWADVAWAASVFGPLFRSEIATVLVGSMWFVPLLLQYYLIFPFALRALDRIGPWRFLIAALAITFFSRWLLLQFGPSFMETGYIARTMTSFAPFRISEFAAGMVIGWLLVHRRAETAEYTTSPFDIAGLIVIAFLMQMGGAVLGPRSDVTRTFADPMIGLGMAVYALPLLFKVPGMLERSVPARALIFMGVISFPVLIVNDGMRYIASFLRGQEIADPAWWFFLVVVYVPVGVLIAYPYALLFGLVPKQRRTREAPEPAVTPPLDLQPAPGGGGAGGGS